MKKFALVSLFIFIANIHFAQNAPIAVNDTFVLEHNGLLFNFAQTLLNNDSDPDLDNLYIDTVIYTGFHQFTSVPASQTFYVAHFNVQGTNFWGIDSAIYIVRDDGSPIKKDTAKVYFYVRHPHYESLNMNNIDAKIGWRAFFLDKEKNYPGYEVPKGSGRHTMGGLKFWIGGKNQDSIYTNATDHRVLPSDESEFGTNGPLSDSIHYDDAEYQLKWDRVWKLDYKDISFHQSNWNTTNYVAKEEIASWPAHGDTTKGQAYYLAPFIDVNNDGVYNPYHGDYPNIKGQQAIYFMYNNERRPSIYINPEIEGMRTEVHVMAYIYDCPSDSALNHTSFVDFKVINRSGLAFDSTYIGINTLGHIGGVSSYMATDVDRNAYYFYNHDDYDDDYNNPNSYSDTLRGYGHYPPAQGVVLLKGANQDKDGIDNNFGIGPDETVNGNGYGDGIIDNEVWGFGSTKAYREYCGFTGCYGIPQNKYENYYLLTGKLLHGDSLIYGGNGNPYTFVGPPTRFHYPGSSDSYAYGTYGVVEAPWAEDSVGNPSAHRHGLGVTGPFRFEPDSSMDITVAFVFGRDYITTGKNAGVMVMQERVDSIRSYYLNDFTTTACGLALAVDKNEEKNNLLTIYPNPFNQQITINYELENTQAQLSVYTVFGKLIKQQIVVTNKTIIDLNKQANGVYFVQVKDGKNVMTKKVIKQ